MRRRTIKWLCNILPNRLTHSGPSRPSALLRKKLRFEPLENRRVLATIWVDPIIPVSGTFSTINGAIAAAHNGDTIKVVGHVYHEVVDVNKSLTIIGGQVRVAGESGASTVEGNQTANGFELDANGITIKNFIIQKEIDGIETNPAFSGFNISNSLFQSDTRGIRLNTSLSTSAKTTTVSGNSFLAGGSLAGFTYDIISDLGARNATISSNAFTADSGNAAVSIAGTSQSSNVQILNNRLSADAELVLGNATKSKIDGNSILSSNSGILFAGGVTNSEIVGNNLINNGLLNGIELNETLFALADTADKISNNVVTGFVIGIYLDGGPGGDTVSGNTVNRSIDDGIDASVTDAGNISSNTVTHSGNIGIFLLGVVSGSVSKNIVADSATDGMLLTAAGTNVSSNQVSDSGDYGIEVAHNNNTLSKNIVTRSKLSGIYLNAVSGTMLTSNNLNDNGDAGLVAVGSPSNTLSGNIANFNISDGFAFEDGSNQNKLTSNTASHNQASGFYVFNSLTNTLSGNQSLMNEVEGFEVIFNSSLNTLSGNTANNNFDNGFHTDGGQNSFTKNTANNNSTDGFFLHGSAAASTISGNTANNNGSTGFDILQITAGTISGNSATANHGDGFSLVQLINSSVSGNTSKNNFLDGIFVAGTSSGNTISGNTATGNGDFIGGFDLFDNSGTTTNNTWTGNKANTRSPAGLG